MIGMGKRILCIGDSNTWGYIPGSGERYEKNVRWTGKLAQTLGENYEVIEEGMNGRTTAFTDKIEPGNSCLGLSVSMFDLTISFGLYHCYVRNK